jgi:hypothetical protein
MYPPERRARGVSLVIFGAVFGAALGPAVFTPLFAGRELAADALVVPWLVGGLFMLAGMGIVWRVRPDPTVIAARLEATREAAAGRGSGLTDPLTVPSGIAAPAPAPGSGAAASLGSGAAAPPLTPGGAAPAAARLAVEAPPRPGPVPAGVPLAEPGATLAEIIRRPGALPALLAASTCYAVMVAVMNLTGHVLVGHGHAQHSVFPVISAHLVGMFGLVLIVGDLVDRLGRGVAMRGGLLAIAVSCAMLGVVDSVPATGVALFGLGLGWSFAYVAATAELSEVAGPSERGRLLGFSDMLAGMSGAALALAGGYTLSTSGVVALAVGSALLAFVPVLVLATRRRPVAVA